MLPFSLAAVQRIDDAFKQPNFSLSDLLELGRDLDRRIVDELSTQIHFRVDTWANDLAKAPLGGWDDAVAKFPQIERDVSEASYCLAFDRSTAAVFHLMRVIDFGLDKMRRMVRVPRRSPSWDGIIVAIDKKLAGKQGVRKTPGHRKRERFLADAVMALRAVKVARNTTMHDYTKLYTPQQAYEVYTAVRSFMLKMSEVA